MSAPRVLLLCEYPTLSGGERSMLSTLAATRAAGFEIAAVVPQGGRLFDELVRRGVDPFPLEIGDPTGERLDRSEIRQHLARIIAQVQPDLVHANSLAMGRISGPVVAELGLPSVSHLRDIVKLSRAAMDDLNFHTRLLAVSEATRAFHVQAGLSAEKTHVLYNGVDLDEFHPRTPIGYLHRELRISRGALLVGAIGQINLRKAPDVFVEVARRVVKEMPEVHFLFVGECFSEKDESRQLERELRAAADGRLAGRLHLLGRRDDIPRVLNELDVLFHPARQEPLGRVLLEAAASGVPIVTTDVGGTPEIFPPHAKAARLTRADDGTHMAAEIVDLLQSGEDRRLLGAAARGRAVAAFDVTRAAEQLVMNYRETIPEFRM